MPTLKILFFLILGLGLESSLAQEARPYRQRKISLKAQDMPLPKLLKSIARQAKVSFSYNSKLIDENQRYSLSVSNTPLIEVLDQVFSNKIRYTFRGKYIILSPAPDVLPKSRVIYIRGYIKSQNSKQALPYSSISIPSKWTASLSNEYGYFELRTNSQEQALNIRFSKQGFWSKELSFIPQKDQFLEIYLDPSPSEAHSPDSLRSESSPLSDSLQLAKVPVPPNRVDSSFKARLKRSYAKIAFPVADFFLSLRQKAHLGNLNESFARNVQFSILPSLSSNRFLGVQTINRFSFNLLGGYTKGIRVLELGGLFNVVRDSVRYFQWAGLSNSVGGQVWGVQSAGLMNQARQGMKGLQLGGLFNYNREDLWGLQAAGLINKQKGRVLGLQAAGLFNRSASDLYGAQLAGIANTQGGTLRGLQVAGLFNYSKIVKHGVQIAPINIVDSAQNLYAFGLLTWVNKGWQYKRLELSLDEHLHLGLSLRTGVPLFYNIFQVARPLDSPQQNALVLGYGLGSSLLPKSAWGVEFDVLAKRVLKANDWKDSPNVWVQGRIHLERKLGKHFSLFGGGSINYWYAREPGTFDTFFEQEAGYHFELDQNLQGHEEKAWVGFQGGLRWVL